ncbi:hypothetical protein Tco_1342191, partial [Tanacetum coccineum]
MSSHKFVKTHNLVAFLEKPAESEGFEQIVDFLNANPIIYALTVNPTIYISCIQQFWDSAKLRTVNGGVQIQALIDGKKIIVNEASIRRDLKLDDAEGSSCLPNATIFEELTRMGYEKDEESVPTPSNDPLPSGEDSKQLNDLMVLCTKLNKQVLDLEKAKSDQAIEIASLKKREDTSKQGRSIRDIDADAEVTLVNETQERQDEDLMFDIGVLDDDEMFVDAITDSTAPTIPTTAGVEDSVAPIISTTVEETLAQILMEIKAAKPKAKGIVFHDQEEQVTMSIVSIPQPSIKDKGKAQLDAEIIEEERLKRQKQEEANIALIKSWENTQAMMEADRLLAERLQTREREELTDEEKGKLFMELMEKRRKHFAPLRAQEKRNRPPTKVQKRTQMSTYLKHMGGYTYKQLKGKSYDEIQKLFDKEMKRVNTIVAMGSEVQENNEKKIEGSKEKAKGSRKKSLGKKRVVKEQQQESPKRQKLEDDKETNKHEEVAADDTSKLIKHLVIKKDDDIAIDAIPLATKPPVIVDYKLLKEGIITHYQLIRADGSSKIYYSMIRMLQGIDREDLLTLWKLVKTKHGDLTPEDKHERVLWGDFKVMFEPDIRSKVWRDLQ